MTTSWGQSWVWSDHLQRCQSSKPNVKDTQACAETGNDHRTFLTDVPKLPDFETGAVPGVVGLEGLAERLAEVVAGGFLSMPSCLSALVFRSGSPATVGFSWMSSVDSSTAAPFSLAETSWRLPFPVFTSSAGGGSLEFSSCWDVEVRSSTVLSSGTRGDTPSGVDGSAMLEA